MSSEGLWKREKLTLHNVFCIVTLSIVIYVDNICIRWETDQKCSPKTLVGNVIVSVLALSAVDREFESRSGQTKDYQLVFVAYNAKHAELRRKSKDWLARNQGNVSEWSDMSICRLLSQWASTIKKNKRVGLEQSEPHHHLNYKLTCSRHDIAEKLLSWR